MAVLACLVVADRMSFLSALSARTIAIAALCAVIIVAAGVYSCTQRGQRIAQAGQDARSANATAQSATVAVKTVLARSEEDAAIDDIVQTAAEKINGAETTQESRDAALAALCSMRSYRDDPACGLLDPDT